MGEWKILEKFNRSLPLPLSDLTLLATHFARLRSRYRLIDDYNNDRLLYIQRAPPVQSASKQIGSRFERSHAIIPISLPYVYQIYIYTHLEFFIFPLYMNSNQPSPNQVALIPASLQLVAITQIPRLSIHNLFVSINVREYVEVIPRPRLIIDCRETQFDIIPYCQNKIRLRRNSHRSGLRKMLRRYRSLSSHALHQPGYFPRPTRSA